MDSKNIRYDNVVLLIGSLCLVLLASGCDQEMSNQRRLESQEQTSVFADGTASRRLPERTISASPTAMTVVSVGPRQPDRRWLARPDAFSAGDGYLDGMADGKLVDEIPEAALNG